MTIKQSSSGVDEQKLLHALEEFQKGNFKVRLKTNGGDTKDKIYLAFNEVIEIASNIANEVEKTGRLVGKEGRVTQRADVRNLSGGWAQMMDSYNEVITDVVQPTAEIARVIGAVAKGDLNQQMAIEFEGRELKGEFLRTAKIINSMVEQLGSFASEVTRVAREVGTEGKLGGQAILKGLAGTWKDLTDSVNSMASNLTAQVRNISEVTVSVAAGDLSKKITVDVRGEFLQLKDTINTMVDQLRSFASEVSRVAREVGTEGKLGGQAIVPGVGGVWKELTDNVNSMAGNLTGQVRNIANVTTAVAKGDLTRKITVDAFGEILELKVTMNTMVDQLNSFASEVTRVAREVGTEGILGGQAVVTGVGGTWKDLTDSVNGMAGNLTSQVRNIAEVTTAVATGDLAKKITVDAKGEILELKNTINTMVDQLSSFASEVTRVAREVGTEGKLGGQGDVKGVSGTWKDLTESVNYMAANLTGQVRNIALVTTAVANGDLTKKITVEALGEILELKNTINTMVDQLSSFASEVTRVAREVGTDGKLGGQGEVRGVSGTWKDLTDNVNFMAANLTGQVRNITFVTTAVANGDLTQKITVEAKGEILELKNTINTMVDQLSSFASEVTRVAREVGTDGKLGGQGEVKGVSGTWKDLTDNVNLLASNLTTQVRNIALVTTAVAKGDLTQKITVEAKGEILELKNTINIMVEQLSSFASEVTRVAREVGSDGKLGGQADVKGVSGTWKDLTDNVNMLASNLTTQVRNIALVTTAVANGDLTKKITVEALGEILALKDTINTMVEQLSSFASEVTRVAREVGTDGKLGGQGQVKGVSGTWKDLTDNVNLLASNLTTQVRNIALVTTAVANGDLSKKITVDAKGEILELKSTINIMVEQLSSFASEVTRVAREVGTDGKLGGQAMVKGVGGTWKDLTDNVNSMAANLTSQVRNIAEVTTAVATGDLSRKITVDARGEILELKNTMNIMVDQLSSFASEVTRVAREVGTEGRLGGQAVVKGVGGTWKDLTDNVNLMANNLTDQVRGIAQVVTAVANGDLKRKLTLQVKGEMAQLAETINSMSDTLATFGDEVTKVAREVGVEGNLGGQAKVPGAAGIWKDLTDNVNQLAANLTTQVRALIEVATAVTKGDLTRAVTVEASGEVNSLKDNINEMVRNLRETTRQNTDQDWLKSNLAKFTRMLQGQKDLIAVSRTVLSELAPLVSAQHGVFYILESETVAGETWLKLLSSYAYKERKTVASRFKIGEGLVGQAAFEKQRILISQVPDDYIVISSGLGEKTPMNIVVLPIIFEGEVKAVIEMASFSRFGDIHLTFLDQLAESIAIVVNNIQTTSRTEELLQQSQSMTGQLQAQQEELQRTNEELEEKAKLLGEQKLAVEQKSKEIELGRIEVEDKAQQLAITSKYKSEFLANMSHELRTPLNSMLILSKMLADNPQNNLDEKQVEYAKTVHGAGTDLLSLINEILDLSKIESGTMALELLQLPSSGLADYVENNFRHVAKDKNIDLAVNLDPQFPATIETDEKRLKQVLKNLLANAFKFTGTGGVTLRMHSPSSGWSSNNLQLKRAQKVLAFSVIDTGIGIPEDKLQIIFEAFQQADSSTSRKYGGTGLGLTISREIATMLGGELKVTSTVGEGSTFTLYLPQPFEQATPARRSAASFLSESPFPRIESLKPRTVDLEVALLADEEIDDDRQTISPEDRVVLIIEDDLNFARILRDQTREKGFKALMTTRGEMGIVLATRFKPDAITLDIHLPDIEGWKVLDVLKHHPDTRHIPVHIISVEDGKQRALITGAVTFMKKPLELAELKTIFTRISDFNQRTVKELLIIEDDSTSLKTIIELLGNGDIKSTGVSSGIDALEALRTKAFDCCVLDLGLPDISGFELIEKIRTELQLENLPIIVYTGRELTEDEELQLRKYAESIIIKGAESPERLLEETALFLHRVEANLPADKRKMIRMALQTDPVLFKKQVLIVDDDVRNIFALTSALERSGMIVQYAENGEAAIAKIKLFAAFDIVLMDIMMPVMDGYDTMRALRKMKHFRKLPMIALTAKAMKGEREKCIEAGASDYISKPVDTDQLLSLMRVWLYKK